MPPFFIDYAAVRPAFLPTTGTTCLPAATRKQHHKCTYCTSDVRLYDYMTVRFKLLKCTIDVSVHGAFGVWLWAALTSRFIPRGVRHHEPKRLPPVTYCGFYLPPKLKSKSGATSLTFGHTVGSSQFSGSSSFTFKLKFSPPWAPFPL